jgi:biotin operon repressor
MQSKKQLILLVLNELNVNSDEKHPLTQTQIAKNLSGKKYTCERKTVCRNIKFLQEMGYPIKKTGKGFYLDKVFMGIYGKAFLDLKNSVIYNL